MGLDIREGSNTTAELTPPETGEGSIQPREECLREYLAKIIGPPVVGTDGMVDAAENPGKPSAMPRLGLHCTRNGRISYRSTKSELAASIERRSNYEEQEVYPLVLHRGLMVGTNGTGHLKVSVEK